MGKSCAVDLIRVVGSSPAGQLLILSTMFFSSYKTSMSTFKSSFQVPHQSFRAQTAVLLTSTSSPWSYRIDLSHTPPPPPVYITKTRENIPDIYFFITAFSFSL